MKPNQPTKTDGWGIRRPAGGRKAPDLLLRIVDGGLCGVIFVAPYFFGGRHDAGRLLLVTIIAATSVAWFVRQAMMPVARWPKTFAYVLLFLACALVAVQIVSLPPEWIAHLAPRTRQLLPLWNGMTASGYFSQWRTLSLIPHETTKALAMALSYFLLFTVVAGRIEEKADADRLLKGVALASIAMAVFGLLQYGTSDGRFFWFYWHPYRLANHDLSGAFINRNHFADFLVLGMGPLVGWLLQAVLACEKRRTDRQAAKNTKNAIVMWSLVAATVVVTMTVLLSRSRGGALAFLAAGAVIVTIYIWRGLADSRFLYGIFGTAVAVIGLLSIHGYDEVAKRLDDFTEGSVESVDQGGIRRIIWAANIEAFKAGWMSGSGAGSHVEVCPVYLPQSFTKEYTHAENGYLQVASEDGIGGLILLAAALLLCAYWCLGGLLRADDPDLIRMLGAATASIASSVVHSLTDFVWYIPACISITLILAACALRLSQMTQSEEMQAVCYRPMKRGRWVERAAAAGIFGGWCVYTFTGPAMAAVHFDRYLRASVANTQISEEELSALVESKPPESQSAEKAHLNDTMINELKQVLKWDPRCARAHLRLAARYVAQFDLLQDEAANAVHLGELRDVLATSHFGTRESETAWLQKAFGANLIWLHRAADEARSALALCPLQGEAYIYLAQLSFLDHKHDAAVSAYIDQALRVRPHNADVVFEVGRQDYIAGNFSAAINRWKQCFGDTGPHQLKIVYLLAGRIPASDLIATLMPDWRTLRGIWTRYHELGHPEDLDALLSYASKCAEHDPQEADEIPPALIWLWQAQFYEDVGRHDDALRSLQRAYSSGSQFYLVRRALAEALKSAGRFAEAEPHYRWCIARRPNDKELSDALVDISKQRLAQREASLEAERQQRLRAAGVPVFTNPIRQTPAPPAGPTTPSAMQTPPATPANASAAVSDPRTLVPIHAPVATTY